MHKNQKPIIPNEPWYFSALKLVTPVADQQDRPRFPAAPAPGSDRPCFPDPPPPGSDRGCLPEAPRPRGPRRPPRTSRLPLPGRDDRGCFP
jgi:hypothetical protein